MTDLTRCCGNCRFFEHEDTDGRGLCTSREVENSCRGLCDLWETMSKPETATIPRDLYDRLVYLGVIDPTGVRDANVGKSNYSAKLIQPWTIWLEYPELTAWDDDIIKRVLRTKEEGGMTANEARVMDYRKIIHDCEERMRQIKNKNK